MGLQEPAGDGAVHKGKRIIEGRGPRPGPIVEMPLFVVYQGRWFWLMGSRIRTGVVDAIVPEFFRGWWKALLGPNKDAHSAAPK